MRRIVVSGPAITIFLGVLLTAIGGLWAAHQRNVFREKISEKNEEIASLNKELSNTLTGGDSYVHLDPDWEADSLLVFLIHKGDFPVYDVEISIRCTDCEGDVRYFPFEDIDPIDYIGREKPEVYSKTLPVHEDIGIVPPDKWALSQPGGESDTTAGVTFLIGSISTNEDKGRNVLSAQIQSRNGIYRQTIVVRHRSVATIVRRMDGKVLYTSIPDGWPEDDETTDRWD